MSLLYSCIFSCFIMVNTLFLLFAFITVESTFKMVSMQVLFSSMSLCVTTLTEPLAQTVTELYQTTNSNDPSGLSKYMSYKIY